MEKTKTCKHCRLEKLTSDFYLHSAGGYETQCKKCRIAKQIEKKQARAAAFEGVDLTVNKNCPGCSQSKPKAEFPMSRGSYDGVGQRCKECTRAATKQWYTTVEGQIVCRLNGAKERARENGREFSLDKDFLLALWNDQNGRCAITGLPILPASAGTPSDRSPFALSIDRIDSSRGYTRNNVRLTTVIGNQAKGAWTDQDVLEMSIAYLRNLGFKVEKGESTNA